MTQLDIFNLFTANIKAAIVLAGVGFVIALLIRAAIKK